jgi:hypothetical protein
MASDHLAELTSLPYCPCTIQLYDSMLSLHSLSQPSSKLPTKPSSKPSNEPSSKHWRCISSRRCSRILVSNAGGSLGTLRSGRRIVLDLRGSLGWSCRWIESDVGGSLGRSGRLVRGSHTKFRNGRRTVLVAGGSHRTFRNGRRIVVSDVGGSHSTFRDGRLIVLDVRGSHRTFRNGRRIVSDVWGSHSTFRNGCRIVS